MIRAILFDKDGTLFDFEASWSAWARAMLGDLAGGDARLAEDLGARIGFDYVRGRFLHDSVAIAGHRRNRGSAERRHAQHKHRCNPCRDEPSGEHAPQIEAVPLAP